MHVTLRPMTAADDHAVRQLQVADDQLRFVSRIEDMLRRLDVSDTCHLIIADDVIAGLFIIDAAYAKKFDFAHAGDLGLIGYFVDRRRQGQGIGTAGVRALKHYLQRAYPAATAVVLTVNAVNPGAVKAYLRGGFVDTGALFHGGRSGPQHIMRMVLTGKTTSNRQD